MRILLTAILLLIASPSWAGTLVQHTGNWSNSVLSLTKAYASNVVAGNYGIIVTMQKNTDGSTPVIHTLSVTDTLSTTYTNAVSCEQTSVGSGMIVSIWYGKFASSGANTVTVAVNTGLNHLYFTIAEVSGLAATSPLDKTVCVQFAGTASISSGASAATTQDSEYMVGMIGTNGDATPITPTNSFTQEEIQITRISMWDKPLTTMGAQSFTATLNAGDNGVIGLATFKNSLATTKLQRKTSNSKLFKSGSNLQVK